MKRVAGDGLLHPVSLAAVLVLVANDHWLKQAHPGALTGKLSDVAGLAFFPLLLASAWEWLQAARRRPCSPSLRALALSTCATLVVFCLIKTWLPALDAYRWSLGVLQAPWRGRVVPARGVLDWTDLVALPALLVPAWIGCRRATRAHAELRARGS